MTSEEKTSSPASFRPPDNSMFIHLAMSLAVDAIPPAHQKDHIKSFTTLMTHRFPFIDLILYFSSFLQAYTSFTTFTEKINKVSIIKEF